MGIFKGPKAPDPYATAQAQAQMNREAAVATQELNMVDQYGPDGSIVYTPIGTSPNGNPRYKVETSLNPTQQQAKDYEQQIDRDTNRLGLMLLGSAQGELSKPIDYSDAAIKAKIDGMINPRLEERFARDRAALETSLINRGIRQGSQAYTDAYGDFEKARTDAFAQEALTNRQQAINELGLSSREAINRIAALLGTGQISAPQQLSTPQANIGAPDFAGMVQSNYQQKVAKNNALLGGLFGAAGTAAKLITGGIG